VPFRGTGAGLSVARKRIRIKPPKSSADHFPLRYFEIACSHSGPIFVSACAISAMSGLTDGDSAVRSYITRTLVVVASTGVSCTSIRVVSFPSQRKLSIHSFHNVAMSKCDCTMKPPFESERKSPEKRVEMHS